MQILLDIDKLKTRAAEVGIAMQDLCREAKVHVSSPSRIRKKGNAHVRTMTKLSLALFRLERIRRDELQKRIDGENP